MKLKVFDVIIAEGSEMECAMYTCIFLETLRMKSEMDKKREVDEWMKKYGDKTFEELMKMERDEEK